MNTYIKQLCENRIMNTDEEFELFEDAIANLADDINIEDIPMLCRAFDDKTKEDEVMFGLIHLIEDFEEEESVKYIVQGILNILDYGYGWAMILTKRILNSEKDRKALRVFLNQLEVENRQKIIVLLGNIKNDNPEQFHDKVVEVLSQSC